MDAHTKTLECARDVWGTDAALFLTLPRKPGDWWTASVIVCQVGQSPESVKPKISRTALSSTSAVALLESAVVAMRGARARAGTVIVEEAV